MGFVLVTCGLVLSGIGTWSGYRNARDAVAPVAHPGDPTRMAIDAARPLHARVAVRRFARFVVAAVAWLVVALYGLFLVSAGTAIGGLA